MTTARPHRLLWSPHPNHNQFLIGSTELRLFQWTPEDADGKPHATPIAVNTDVALMKCFTWSPDPNYMDLTAVGLTTGRTLLIRMHRSEPWIFEDKGNDFRSDTPRQVSIAQNQRTYPSFSARHSRACNVVAFSKGSPNLLAVGLDKVRNDYCLMVWDIEQSMSMSKGSDSTYASSGSISMTNRSTTGSVQTSRFGRNNEYTESYFDTRLSMNPLSLADTGTARALNPSNYDQSTDVRPLCQYGSSEVISSCAWFTNQPKVLAAGMGMKYIRVYDTREDPNSPSSLVISTKAVHGLCMDPFHENRMASCSDDGVIKIWDIRNPSQQILSFYTGPKAAPQSSTLVRISFNPQRSGLLATLTKEATCIKVWDIQEGTIRAPRNISRMDSGHNLEGSFQQGGGGAGGLLSKSHDREGLQTVRESEPNESEIGIPILWKSRRTKPSSKPLQSFAWIPTFVSNSTSGLISINKESLIETTLLKETSHIAWEPKGTLVLSDGSAISSFPSQHSSATTVPEPAPQGGLMEMRKRNSKVINLQLPANRKVYVDSAGPTDSVSTNPPPSISVVVHNGLAGDSIKTNGMNNIIGDSVRRSSLTPIVSSNKVSTTAAQVGEVLEQDISVVMREGAIKGYSMDATTNVDLVSPGPLKDFWSWMTRAEKIAQKDGARIGKFDFSYQGVLPVLLGNGVSRRSTPSGTPRALSPLPRTSSDLSTQLSKQADEIPIVPTLKLAQRKLGLKLCGSELLKSDLKKNVEKLEEEGSYEAAAGWAFFHGELDLAIEVLGRGDEKLKLMSIVVAGFNRNQGSMSSTAIGGLSGSNEKASNNAWKAQCKIHSQGQSNPYIRAIFSYIASGDWRDVLEEKSLSLADRVGVALRFLSDDELMAYIQTTADTLTNLGEIDGMILTGLTEAGLDLLTNYINRTGDIQTAALVSSVAVPRYFKDGRVEDWVDCYRDLLDRWQLYHTRARFDIARGRYIQQSTLSGVSVADITPTQIYVRCNFCNQSIARNLLIPGVRGRDGRRLVVQGGPGSGGHGGLHGHDKQGSMAGGMGQGAVATSGAPGSGSGPAASSNKSTVCPSCSKPLPRCAICLLHLGVPAEGNASLGVWSSLGHKVTGETMEMSTSKNQSPQTAGKWGQKEYADPNIEVTWASDRPIYEWKEGYTDETAPVDIELEHELFSEENRINRGIHFDNYKTIPVNVYGGPDNRCIMHNFKDLALHPIILENIMKMKFEEPTPIQQNATPLLFAGYDLLACAQTGSGKTAAFLIPILSRLLTKLSKIKLQENSPGARRVKASPLALIILPTRELGIQMFDAARQFTYKSRLRPVVIYGGAEMKSQKEQLAKGCDILIATPGRLIDAVERGLVSLSKIKYTVLDEADRILDMGFEPAIRQIMSATDMPKDESLQIALFSATFPSNIQVLARDFLKSDYIRIRIGRIGGTTSDITQKVVKVEDYDKEDALIKLLISQPPSRTMIFVDSKRRADNLDDILYNKHFPCISLHGDRNQREREAAMDAFKSGRSPILVTTSVASRGLDIKDVLHVINYDMCNDIDEYVHRIGRTARAGNPGLATTFYTDRNTNVAPQLVKLLIECEQVVPDFLQEFIDEATTYENEDFIEEDDGFEVATDDKGNWSPKAQPFADGNSHVVVSNATVQAVPAEGGLIWDAPLASASAQSTFNSSNWNNPSKAPIQVTTSSGDKDSPKFTTQSVSGATGWKTISSKVTTKTNQDNWGTTTVDW
ncbi:hypothetical protein FBU30_010724 [Linnemannia zychae]|nr:hypothetical protein FBU30_010724 [Linnemannia zychae]